MLNNIEKNYLDEKIYLLSKILTDIIRNQDIE